MKRAIANEGPRMKRIRPAPMGRAYRYQRRMSHIEIALAEKAAGNGQGRPGATTVGEGAPAKKRRPRSGREEGPAKKAAGEEIGEEVGVRQSSRRKKK